MKDSILSPVSFTLHSFYHPWTELFPSHFTKSNSIQSICRTLNILGRSSYNEEPDAADDGTGKEAIDTVNQGLRGEGGNEVPVEGNENMEFESLDSSILSELRVMLSDLSNPQGSPVWEGSDPDITRFLVGLVGDDVEKLSNPFELANSVRRELVSRAEEAGARALAWDLSQFDKVGGKGTVIAVWNKLKSENRVGGLKRQLSCERSEDGVEK